MTPYDPTSPGYAPQFMPPDVPQTPNGIPGMYTPGMSDIAKLPGPSLQNYMGSLSTALNAPKGPGQQMQQMGAPPPPPQMAPSAGVHPGSPAGMDPAALQNMMQIYKTLQPSGQLGVQMQAAGVGTGQGQVPGLLSRFQ